MPRRHEIVGIVTEVGAGVTDFKVGDRAGIGCFVRACRECRQCQKGTDQYCSKMVRLLEAICMLYKTHVRACQVADLGEFSSTGWLSLPGVHIIPDITQNQQVLGRLICPRHVDLTNTRT